MIRKIKSFFNKIYLAIAYVPIVSFKRSELDKLADGNWYEVRYYVKVDPETKTILVASAIISKVEKEEDLELGKCKDCKCK